MNAVPLIIFWILIFWAGGSQKRLIYLFFSMMPFGTFAILPPELTAGLTLTPTPMVALVILMRHLASKDMRTETVRMAKNINGLGILSLFLIVSTIVTLFMPRLFAGQITVIPMSIDATALGAPLEPTTQNISQLAYLAISVGTVFTFASMLKSKNARDHAVGGIIVGGCLVVITGILDFSSNYIPITVLLDPFRTATYALLTDDMIAGSKRVVGLMPEASAYGGLILTFLSTIYFIRRSIKPGFIRRKLIPTLMVMLLLMLWLSTSSGALVGFFVFCLAVAIEWMWRAMHAARRNPLRRGVSREFAIFCLGSSLVCLILLIDPQLLSPITDNIDLLVFQKTTTSSFEERSAWTTVSWQALFSSYGLGVGAGGTRASNGIVAILSNTGFLGGALYFSFVVKTFFRRAARRDYVGEVILSAIFWAFLPPFAASVLSATTPDFGLFNAFLFGLALAVESTSRRARTADDFNSQGSKLNRRAQFRASTYSRSQSTSNHNRASE